MNIFQSLLRFGLIIGMIGLWPDPAGVRANILDGFEGGKERWQLWDHDTNCQIRFQQIVVGDAHSGATSELIEVSCQNGQFAYFVYPIGPTAIIHDLSASLWVRAVSGGMQLGFRIVFPNAIHPTTGKPIARVVTGSKSKGGGVWSQLEVRAPDQSLAGVQHIILHQFPDADLRGAYVDAVVLDCYTGPGVVKIQIDDLVVEPMIDARLLPAPSSRVEAEQKQDRDALAGAQLSERKKDLRASVPRWLQYNGEDLYRLKSVGFTGVVLNRAPDPRLADEARQLQMDIVAPPPLNLAPEENLQAWNGVSVWLIGSALSSAQLDSSRGISQRVARFPTTLLRPALVEPLEQTRSFSRFSDLLAIPLPYAPSVRKGTEQTQLVRQAFEEARGGTLNLVSLNTEPLSEWSEQNAAAAAALTESTPYGNSDLTFDRLQARLQLYRSVGAGAQGWFFRSQQSLELGSPVEDARRNTLQSLNAELARIAPWIQGAQSPSTLTSISSKEYTATLHALPNSKLIILQATGDYDSLCPTAPRIPELRVQVPPQGQDNQVIRISDWHAEAMKFQTIGGMVHFTIPNPSWVELIVITGDPTVLQFLQRPQLPTAANSVAPALANLGPTVADERLDIANQLSMLASRTLSAEAVPPVHEGWTTIENAQAQLRNATQYLSRSEFARAIASAERSALYSQSVIRASWQRAMERQRFSAPQSSPWMCSSLSLPLHWQLIKTLGTRTWQTFPVPGGDMNQFQEMKELGWVTEKNPRLAELTHSQMDVLPSAGPDGSGALHLVAQPARGQSLEGGYAGAALIVRSPKIMIPQANMVRIDGLVRVVSGSDVPQAGLLVYDNIIGPAFGQLISIDPNNPKWQRISLFRMVPSLKEAPLDPAEIGPSPLRVLFEVRGAGEYLIDQLSVSTIAVSPYPAFPVSLYQDDSTAALAAPKKEGKLIRQPQR